MLIFKTLHFFKSFRGRSVAPPLRIWRLHIITEPELKYGDACLFIHSFIINNTDANSQPFHHGSFFWRKLCLAQLQKLKTWTSYTLYSLTETLSTLRLSLQLHRPACIHSKHVFKHLASRVARELLVLRHCFYNEVPRNQSPEGLLP